MYDLEATYRRRMQEPVTYIFPLISPKDHSRRPLFTDQSLILGRRSRLHAGGRLPTKRPNPLRLAIRGLVEEASHEGWQVPFNKDARHHLHRVYTPQASPKVLAQDGV